MLPELDFALAVPASPTTASAIRAIELELKMDAGQELPGCDVVVSGSITASDSGADSDLSSLLDNCGWDELCSSSESSDSGCAEQYAASPPWAALDEGEDLAASPPGSLYGSLYDSPPGAAAELASAAGRTTALAPASAVGRGWRRPTAPRQVQPRRFDALVKTVTPAEEDKLAAAGIELPRRFPVPKAEEKRVRGALRKIRNKASAQRSRKNKEVYIAELEGRMDEAAAENDELAGQVSHLATENRSLLAQLADLRAALTTGLGRVRAGGATLMVALLCVGFGAAAGPSPGRQNWAPAGRRTRTLLGADTCAGTDWPCAWLVFAAAATLAAVAAVAVAARRAAPPPVKAAKAE